MIGQAIGVYQVLSKLGEGGMGEVYRARDTKLNRDVAIKVLPESFALDADRVARFTREAQVLASLNHPNIAQIYGIEESGTTRALVMELVEGQDLSELIGSRLRAQGSGLREHGSRLKAHGSGTKDGSGLRAHGSGTKEHGSRLRAQGSGTKEHGSGLRAHGSGLKAQGAGLPLDEALAIARQIADALEAAHEQGIVHRDLKPANVKVRADGTVKVLDFGLAKAVDPAQGSGLKASSSMSPTITTPAMTQAGMILGTAAYMSPEQARGKAVDKRADIWAFGAVLFEMLTGQRAFPGEDITDTLAAVVRAEPEWTLLPGELPPTLLTFLKRCLHKDPKQRLGDIHDMRLALDGAFDTAGSPTRAAVPSQPHRAWLPWLLGGGGMLVGALLGWATLRTPQAERPVARVHLGIEPAERLLSGFGGDVTSGHGRPSRTAMAFSPDGRALVFTAEREGHVQLFLRRLDQLEASPVAGTEGASTPFFSPDGLSVGFYADGALKKVPTSGGPIVEVCKTELVYGASWSSKDQIVFGIGRGGLLRVPAAGGTPVALTQLQSESREFSHRLPQVLPDGDTVLFTVTNDMYPSWDDTRIAVQSLTTGTRKTLIEGAADARFVASGHVAYLSRGTLMAVPFDVRRLEVTGAAVGVASDVMQAANIQPSQLDTGAGQFAVSSTGSLVYVTGGLLSQDRWAAAWVDRSGRSEPLRMPAGMWHVPAIAPDGQHIAFGADAVREADIWMYDVQRGSLAKLPLPGNQDVPLWMPDRSHLTFVSLTSGHNNSSNNFGAVTLFDPDGKATAEPLAPTVTGAPGSWTPDGRTLALTNITFDQSGGRVRSVWVAERDGKAAPRLMLPNSAEPTFSADGRWLAYLNTESGQVYVQPYPALDHRVQVSVDGGSEPTWRRDGKELYYLQDVSAGGVLHVRVMAVPVTTSPTFSAGTPHVLFEGPYRTDGGAFRNYDVAADGQRFVMVQEVPHPPAHVSHMVLVQNWVEELKQKVPVKK